VGKTWHGIYRLEADTLTIAANEPGQPATPPSFTAPGVRLEVFQQAPP
jgi:uncharacterized protein (TIGR03067 family)